MQTLSRIPWFVSAPAFVVVVVVFAMLSSYLGGSYFERTFLEEENPLVTSSEDEPDDVAMTPVVMTEATPVPTTSTEEPTPTQAPAGPVVVSAGEFRDGAPGHFGSGTATLGKDADGNAVLVLSDFSVTNGPDLHVILGPTDEGGGNGLDLGELKATDGTFSYAVPADVDLESFRSVTIWCKSFPTVFAVATLEGS